MASIERGKSIYTGCVVELLLSLFGVGWSWSQCHVKFGVAVIALMPGIDCASLSILALETLIHLL